MLITELTVKKDQQHYLEKKLNTIKIFIGLYAFVAILSIAFLIYAGVSGITDTNPYLFGGFALAGTILYGVILVLEYRAYSGVNSNITSNGEGVIRTNYNVNLKRKLSGNTIVNWIAFGIVLVCVVTIVIAQIISFNAVDLGNLLICVALSVIMLYQSINETINDKLYQECILGKDNK